MNARETADLKQYVDDTKEELFKAIGTVQASVGALGQMVTESVGTLSKKVESRLSGVERQQREQKEEMANMSAKIQRLEQILGGHAERGAVGGRGGVLS